MEHKSCPVFVDGKECDRPLTLVDLEGKKIARYDLATYECNLRHRTYFCSSRNRGFCFPSVAGYILGEFLSPF